MEKTLGSPHSGAWWVTHLSISHTIYMTITTDFATNIDVAKGGGDEGREFVYAQRTRGCRHTHYFSFWGFDSGTC
jgi:hypothetical protein